MKPADIEDLYELSPLQQGILFHSLSASDPGVYLVTVSYVLKGHLDEKAFELAWQRTVDRNPVLRTSFHLEGINKPLQVVHRRVGLSCEKLDWRRFAPDEQGERVAAFLEGEQARGFALDRPPLMRLTLIRTGEDRHRLIWTFHHIVLEGWSASLLLQEAFAHYHGLRRGEEVALPARRPFRDYIVWLQQRDPSRAEAHWRRTLEGFSLPTPLPLSPPPIPEKARELYGRRRLTLSPATTAALASLGRRNGLTQNTVLQGAWAVLLSRYSGEEDVLFGTVVSGRQEALPDAQSMVGLFVNTLPTRVTVRPDAPVLPWLQELQNRQAQMREYEYTSLLQVQSWSDLPRGTRLFESIFGFENWIGDVSLRGLTHGLEVEEVWTLEGGTGYPLTLAVGPGSQITALLTYDRGRFDGDAVARLAGHYQNLVEGIVARPEARLSDLPLLGEPERNQVLVEGNDTQREFPRQTSIARLFERQAAETPDATAVVFAAGFLTYGELNRRSNQLARYLQGLGVGPETRVGIAMERSLEMVVGLLAILKAGGAYVPLDPSYPPERLAFMLVDAAVPVLVTQERLLSALPEHGARVVCVDRDRGRIGEESGENLATGASADNVAYVIYTSGSTGRPKGVQVTHRGLCNLAEAEISILGVHAGSRVLQFASLSFDASIFEIAMAFRAGACLCLATREALLPGPPLLEVLREQEVSIVVLPPSALAALPAEKLPTLEVITVAGEKCPAELVNRWGAGRRFFNLYGPTEATVWSAYTLCQGGDVDPPIGGPIGNTKLYVLDSSLQPLPLGIPGELYIGGVGLARGYLNRPELTAERFLPDPFADEPGARLYRSGDRVRRGTDGAIEFLGRVDHQVKVRGFRIELGEIEALLKQHPAVRESAAVIREDQPGDPRIVVYVVPQPASTAAPADLRGFLRAKLPEYMVPSAFVLLEALPLNGSGKLDRRALPAPEGSPEAAYIAPRDGLEGRIAGIWQEVLGTSRVGIHDNFFDLGGHSLLIIRVHRRLREAFPEGELPVVALFEHPTIASLAARLRAAAEGAGSLPETGRAVETPEESQERLGEARQRLGRRRAIARELEGGEGADA